MALLKDEYCVKPLCGHLSFTPSIIVFGITFEVRRRCVEVCRRSSWEQVEQWTCSCGIDPIACEAGTRPVPIS
jgi:hypothetical protein